MPGISNKNDVDNLHESEYLLLSDSNMSIINSSQFYMIQIKVFKLYLKNPVDFERNRSQKIEKYEIGISSSFKESIIYSEKWNLVKQDLKYF